MQAASPTERSTVVVIAGPNGVGKSTAAPFLLKGALGVLEFVNAAQIAFGLSAYVPESVAFQAGRIMLRRMLDRTGQWRGYAGTDRVGDRAAHCREGS